MSTVRMGTSLVDEVGGIEGELGARRGPKRSDYSDDGSMAVSAFRRGVAALGAQKAVAVDLGLSDSHLSDYLNGRRTIPFHLVVRLCRLSPDAAAAVLAEPSRIGGLAAPMQPRRVSKRQAQEALARKVRSVTQLYSIMRSDVAAELGTTPDDLDRAFEDPTHPIELAALR